ncbi:hypothetical protein [Nitrososphaeria virus YSH_1032793]|uniref:Uncharacterized protein n=1 Tax=Nitrososphaeria virus YSH_1032793 TaxID=3071320 RepID=A0A976UAB7_9CAUD|nr:hypothetical protein QKV91_gp19 [Yangshan Harbor Nitrososphaeria virus]UVF62223.1 hypothetical protein [Nitrososphaeria virus YSH_1032793]
MTSRITEEYKATLSESTPDEIQKHYGEIWDEFKAEKLKPKSDISEEECIKLLNEKEEVLEQINFIAVNCLKKPAWNNWNKEEALKKWKEYKEKGSSQSSGFGNKKFFTPRTTEQKVADTEAFYKILENKKLLADIEPNQLCITLANVFNGKTS